MASALRSSRWFDGDSETALQNRAALRSLGIEIQPGKPVIGISNTVSDLNPCNSGMSEQIQAARDAVLHAGGTPVVFPTISLGEDLMKPTAMLYRNLLAVEVEEMTRAYPIDALILTANCDKTIPGALMGAASTNVPTVLMLGGPRPIASFRGKPISAGTDLWKMSEQHRSGSMSDEDWSEFERCYSCGIGACNVMGTAVTMAAVAEVLGFVMSGASTVPSGDPAALAAARRAGERAVALASEPVRPRDLITVPSLLNAVRVVAALGGSTNALIHLAAIAGRVGIRLSVEQMTTALSGQSVIADVQPIGRYWAQHFHAAGGVPTVARRLAADLDVGCRNVEGRTLLDVIRTAQRPGPIIGDPEGEQFTRQSMQVVSGTLAPSSAVIKAAAASEHLLVHRGRAVVFDGYEDLQSRIDRDDLDVDESSVLVLRGAGPVGGPGMPEWGMVPIPAKLARAGVTDMVRVSDARMSGTSFGTVVLHVAPEAAVGGPLALVRDGDVISLDVRAGRLDLEVSPEELRSRRESWRPPQREHRRGWVSLYLDHVTQAPEGCDLDFLQAFEPGTDQFVEPIVGRS